MNYKKKKFFIKYKLKKSKSKKFKLCCKRTLKMMQKFNNTR